MAAAKVLQARCMHLECQMSSVQMLLINNDKLMIFCIVINLIVCYWSVVYGVCNTEYT